ncbi:CYCLOPS transcription factor [Heracleum sosnowskyi]|uniref:CYCLOPS transcription factor n=1 Tax=Heracleum sosnowskyi TaxID=360622 RepID=A0AAD8MIY7_9APIA|nr:CYCLOPS transcription factor [Heracleum sosnowskyi]
MVHDGKKRSSVDSSYLKPEPSHQNFTSPQTQAVQRIEAGKSLKDMEERRFSDLYRNTTEELFIKTFMEGSAAPTMDMLGFKNLTQNFRADSEELFNSWLTNGENQVINSASIPHRTRQASRRITSELNPLNNQHNGTMLQKQGNENSTSEHACIAEESSNDFNQYPASSSVVERGVPTGNLYLAKAWFHSSQPMTRSRSSELRKRYVASQNSQTAFGIEAMHNINASGYGISNLQQDFTNSDRLSNVPFSETLSHLNTFMSPSNSSSSNFNSPHMGTVDNVSSVVSMLKGTLERKWLNNQNEKCGEDSSLGYYGVQGVVANSSLDQEQELQNYKAQGTFQDTTTLQVLDPEVLQRVQGLLDMESEETVAPINPVQMHTVSREQSQSESSAATPAVSIGFDAYDGPSNSGQARSNGESSRQQAGNEKKSENGIRAKDIRKRIHDNQKEDSQQKGGLVRYGSVSSAGSADKGDPTKKRRVERSRKMAEAKERVLTPAIPSDMQSVLKRCENLEKEARSLKLNLSFMNRKDSEQTKQIEELQKQNDELTDEKERLLEEIERIISETSKM